VSLRLKIEGLRAVTVADVAEFVRRLPRDQIWVGTLGPRALE
jgi:predicted Zn-dependent peptidase